MKFRVGFSGFRVPEHPLISSQLSVSLIQVDPMLMSQHQTDSVPMLTHWLKVILIELDPYLMTM